MTNVAEVKPPSSKPLFCTRCGDKLFGVVVFCPYCGNQMPDAEGKKVAIASKASEKEVARKKSDLSAPAAKMAVPVSEAVKPKVSTPAESDLTPPPPVPKAAQTPPASAPTPSAPPPPSPPPTAPTGGGGGKGWVIALLVAGAAGWWFFGRDKGPDACDKALADSQVAIGAGQVEEARVQSRAAAMVCTDSSRAKKAKEAEQAVQALVKEQAHLQAEKDRQDRQAAKNKADCDRRYHQARQLLMDRKPASAARAAAALEASCVELLDGQVASLTVEIQAQAMRADYLVQVTDEAIEAGNLTLAAQKVEQLAGEDREHAQLASLRARVARLSSPPPAPEVVTPPPASAPVPTRSVPMPAPAPRPAPVQQSAPVSAPAAQQDNAQRDMANAFLRDAESSMQRHLYDEAKTYVKSAERMDPRNPDIARMKQRITQHELDYMRKAIVIQ